MAFKQLRINSTPTMGQARMVLGFSGWMDGGEVSTGTIDLLAEQVGAEPIGRIEPDEFYIYNFPGSMEVAALFRPYGKIEEGLLTEFQQPDNLIHCAPASDLVLINAKEPHLRWHDFADCIFELCRVLGIDNIYFIGSVGGLVTHTREPRMMCIVSDPAMKPAMTKWGFHFSNYEGPVSFVTCLMNRANEEGVRMSSIVAEIPAYVQGRNPKSIEAIMRKIAAMLSIPITLDELRVESDEWERRVTEAVQKEPELAAHVRKLEADYDDEIFDTQMSDLKDLLTRRGVRLD